MKEDATTVRKRYKDSSMQETDEKQFQKIDKQRYFPITYLSLCIDVALESLLGYVLWSIFFSVAPTIWFYPLNELEISGYEAFAVLLLSPALAGIPSFKAHLKTQGGLSMWRGLSVLGILSYHAPSTLSRLILNSISTSFAMLWLTGMIWYTNRIDREVMFLGLTLGFILKLVIRIASSTLNIIWSSSLGNTVLCVLSMISVMVRHFRWHRQKSEQMTTNIASPRNSHWFVVGIGFGAWLFLLQLLFGEVSVVLRWCGSSAPNNVYTPNPYGLLVLFSLAVGIVLSQFPLSQHFIWWILACISASIFYYGPHQYAFGGSCVLAMYTMSIFPKLWNQVRICESVKCICLALTLFVILILASVWTVAYNFVPGGVYTREGNHVLLAITIIMIGLGTVFESSVDMSKDVAATAVGNQGDGYDQYILPDRKARNVTFLFLVLLLLVGCGFMKSRYDSRELKRAAHKHRHNNIFTSAIWTVHFGFDNKGWSSISRAAHMLGNTEADVIGILESDCSRPYLGSTDFVQYMEENLGYYSDYGPATKDHTWGAGILSKYPIVNSTHHLLPSPVGELAPAVSAVININGNHITFVVVHMGNDGDDIDRQLQAEELARIMRSSNTPVVFLGYVTSRPESRDYNTLIQQGRMIDIDREDYDRWCEYIFYRGLIRLGYARISRASLSDTEIQMGKFKIPVDANDFKDFRFTTTNQYDVEESHRFPTCFEPRHDYGYYGPHHRFHMGTPKYFL